MVCAICCESLFSAMARDMPEPADGNRIAALKCGHTFHLDCITSWHSHDSSRSCPLCKDRHIGSVLMLHIECDREHASDRESKELDFGRLFIGDRAKDTRVHCILLLDSAKQLESKCDKLKSELAVLQIESNGVGDNFKQRQVSEGAFGEKLASLDKLANTLSMLLATHKSHIRFMCGTPGFKEAIAELEKNIHENDNGSQ